MSRLLAPNGARQILIAQSIAEPLFDAEAVASMPRRRYDVVVVGAGVAGLAFTLRLPTTLRVALLTKGRLGESNTRYAQGGLSAALGRDDSPALHEIDTIAAGAGLCAPETVRRLVEGAPAAIAWLLNTGARFDRDPASGDLMLGREAAHSRRRVLHAGGDATGAEIERALVESVRARPTVEVHENAVAIDLLIDGDRASGLVAELEREFGLVCLDAPVVVIAAGGAGQLWATTSNPLGATADGLSMAMRAGVAVADLEFVQFHPTVLTLPDAAPFLISEAVRGEGAYLRGRDGERFMCDVHPLAELAPRDVVARAIQRQMALDGMEHVSLDLRHLDSSTMRARFPTIAARLAERGVDLATDLIPISPAAHYFMGGIVASPTGETSLHGLLALGEASCTGVHGANRLASNSLLEGLVFGLAAAEQVICDRSSVIGEDGAPSPINHHPSPTVIDRGRLQDLRRRLQRTMSRHVAVVRDAAGLGAAANEITAIAGELSAMSRDHREVWELKNMALAASGIVTAALHREESRGAHFRSDYPDTDPTLAGRHLIHTATDAGWRYGRLSPTPRVAEDRLIRSSPVLSRSSAGS